MKMKPVYAAGRSVRLSPLQRILQKTGRRPTECRCQLCKRQCHTPCLATPHDILRLMDAGYTSRLAPTLWAAGMVMEVLGQTMRVESTDGQLSGLGFNATVRDDLVLRIDDGQQRVIRVQF